MRRLTLAPLTGAVLILFSAILLISYAAANKGGFGMREFRDRAQSLHVYRGPPRFRDPFEGLASVWNQYGEKALAVFHKQLDAVNEGRCDEPVTREIFRDTDYRGFTHAAWHDIYRYLKRVARMGPVQFRMAEATVKEGLPQALGNPRDPSEMDYTEPHGDDKVVPHLEGNAELSAKIKESALDLLESASTAARAKLFDADAHPGNKSRLLILTGITDSTADRLEALSNHQEYAHTHGYGHMHIDLEKYVTKRANIENPTWLKIPAIQEAFARNPDVEWVWWLEPELRLVNRDLDIYSQLLVPSALGERIVYDTPLPGYHDDFSLGGPTLSKDEVDLEKIRFLISHDGTTLDTSSFLVKRSPMSDIILQKLGSQLYIRDKEISPQFPRRDRDALTYMYLGYPLLQQQLAIVPHNFLNSYEGRLAHQEGDLVMHAH